MFNGLFITMRRQKSCLLTANLLLVVTVSIYVSLYSKNQHKLFIIFRQVHHDPMIKNDPKITREHCLISGNKRHNISLGNDDSTVKIVKVETNTTLIKLDCPKTNNCDCDCCLLHHKLKTWPKEKPKGVIYFLSRHSRVKKLIIALQSLDKYFNNVYRYPVVIFHENETDSEKDRLIIASNTNSEIYFQLVQFSVPSYVNKTSSSVNCWFANSFGYRHMCRFHAFGVYDQPIIRHFQYGWRLDDDSEIIRPINVDVFKHMRDRNLKYGYLLIEFDVADCIIGLWDAVRFYIKNKTVETTNFFKEWKDGMIYYNNFEISAISFWLSDEYRKYFDFIDRQGGIYTHRWGDAPIKSIAVAMFANKNETYQFKTIGYKHYTRKT